MAGVPGVRRPAAVLSALLAGLVLAVGLSACGGGSGRLTAYAVFSDVSDLAVGAPVQMADITIGSVTGVGLQGIQARVTLSIDRSARVPADVSAQVQRTTILGERIVELVAPPGGGGGGRLLADGATIGHAQVVPDLEQLVKGGTQLFIPISASALASLVQAGGQGFGAQAGNIHRLIRDLNDISAGYAAQSSTIRSLLAALDQLGSSTAPDAKINAEAVTNLARTTDVLAAQSARFNDLLGALNGLSVQGRSLLDSYLSQIGIQLSGLQAVTHAVASEQQDLGKVLFYLKGHNQVISQATLQRFVQVLDDLVVCGLPNGGADSSPAGTCTPSGPPQETGG